MLLQNLLKNFFFISGSVEARIVNQLLVEMDGMQQNKQVFIIGATNRSLFQHFFLSFFEFSIF